MKNKWRLGLLLCTQCKDAWISLYVTWRSSSIIRRTASMLYATVTKHDQISILGTSNVQLFLLQFHRKMQKWVEPILRGTSIIAFEAIRIVTMFAWRCRILNSFNRCPWFLEIAGSIILQLFLKCPGFPQQWQIWHQLDFITSVPEMSRRFTPCNFLSARETAVAIIVVFLKGVLTLWIACVNLLYPPQVTFDSDLMQVQAEQLAKP